MISVILIFFLDSIQVVFSPYRCSQSALSKDTSEKANKCMNVNFQDFHMLNYYLSNDTRFCTNVKQNIIVLVTLFCINLYIDIHRLYSDDRLQIC